MKRLLTLLLVATACLPMMSEDDWHPLPSWPFIYKEFQPAVVHTNNGKTLKINANIHIGRHRLWYRSSKLKNLEAKQGLIRDMRFSNGEQFIETEGKLCRVVREDTIRNNVHRLLQSIEIDMPRYNETVRNMKMAESSSTLDLMGLNDMNLDMSVRESSELQDQLPLPLREVYYIQMGSSTFEATESNILKHLADKEERNAYRTFTRRAEIITGNLDSMLDVYTTFFTK